MVWPTSYAVQDFWLFKEGRFKLVHAETGEPTSDTTLGRVYCLVDPNCNPQNGFSAGSGSSFFVKHLLAKHSICKTPAPSPKTLYSYYSRGDKEVTN